MSTVTSSSSNCRPCESPTAMVTFNIPMVFLLGLSRLIASRGERSFRGGVAAPVLRVVRYLSIFCAKPLLAGGLSAGGGGAGGGSIGVSSLGGVAGGLPSSTSWVSVGSGIGVSADSGGVGRIEGAPCRSALWNGFAMVHPYISVMASSSGVKLPFAQRFVKGPRSKTRSSEGRVADPFLKS